jgi:hypothetical protein
MRALHSTLTFFATSLLLCGSAAARVPTFAPRVSLSLALDWNNLALRALQAPPRSAAPVAPRRHTVPKMTVTDGAVVPPAAQLDTQAVGRVEGWARSVVAPRLDPGTIDPHRRIMMRAAYLTPYAPYVGCYGVHLTVETDALLR